MPGVRRNRSGETGPCPRPVRKKWDRKTVPLLFTTTSKNVGFGTVFRSHLFQNLAAGASIFAARREGAETELTVARAVSELRLASMARHPNTNAGPDAERHTRGDAEPRTRADCGYPMHHHCANCRSGMRCAPCYGPPGCCVHVVLRTSVGSALGSDNCKQPTDCGPGGRVTLHAWHWMRTSNLRMCA